MLLYQFLFLCVVNLVIEARRECHELRTVATLEVVVFCFLEAAPHGADFLRISMKTIFPPKIQNKYQSFFDEGPNSKLLKCCACMHIDRFVHDFKKRS